MCNYEQAIDYYRRASTIFAAIGYPHLVKQVEQQIDQTWEMIVENT
jgi:23S rRNA maturation mini-RNase III